MQFLIIGKDGTDENAQKRRFDARQAYVGIAEKNQKIGAKRLWQ